MIGAKISKSDTVAVFFFERSLPPLTWLEVRFVLDHFPGNKKNNNNKTQGHLKASQNSCYGAISFQTL